MVQVKHTRTYFSFSFFYMLLVFLDFIFFSLCDACVILQLKIAIITLCWRCNINTLVVVFFLLLSACVIVMFLSWLWNTGSYVPSHSCVCVCVPKTSFHWTMSMFCRLFHRDLKKKKKRKGFFLKVKFNFENNERKNIRWHLEKRKKNSVIIII